MARMPAGKRLGLPSGKLERRMRPLWRAGSLADYFRASRSRYQAAILSNSFVEARREEQQRYQVKQMCDLIIYSHHVGMEKPDQRI